jgi:hypothetical protein
MSQRELEELMFCSWNREAREKYRKAWRCPQFHARLDENRSKMTREQYNQFVCEIEVSLLTPTANDQFAHDMEELHTTPTEDGSDWSNEDDFVEGDWSDQTADEDDDHVYDEDTVDNLINDAPVKIFSEGWWKW